MDRYCCGTDGCKNRIKYHNVVEDCYYCTSCAVTMFEEGECQKIGSMDITRQILTLCKSLLDEFIGYVTKERHFYKWNFAIDQQKNFFIELSNITMELQEVTKEGRIKDYAKLQQRAINLNKAFRKYLLQKEISGIKLKEKMSESSYESTNTEDTSDKSTHNEEEKTATLNSNNCVNPIEGYSSNFETKDSNIKKYKNEIKDEMRNSHNNQEGLKEVIDNPKKEEVSKECQSITSDGSILIE